MTFSAAYLEQILRFAALRGMDRGPLLQQAGLPSDWMAGQQTSATGSLEERYPEAVYTALLEGAAQQTGDAWFGLHLGQWMNLAAGGLVGQLLRSSATLGQALEHLCAFAALGCQALPLRLERGVEESLLVLVPNPDWEARAPDSVRHTEDFFLAFGVREVEWLHQFQRKPLGIDWRRPKPAQTQAAQKALGVELRFSQAQTAMRIRTAWLDDPVVHANPGLLHDLVELAERQLNAGISDGRLPNAVTGPLPDALSMASRTTSGLGPEAPPSSASKERHNTQAVRQLLLALQGDGFPSLEEVASKLCCSPRSLQRRLACEGVTYRKLLDQVQDQRARELLLSGRHSIAEVAWLSGYRDAASLTRAFRRRHGKPPKAYREAL